MSRIPQPFSSRTTSSKSTATPPSPSKPRAQLSAISTPGSARIRTQSVTPRTTSSTTLSATTGASKPPVPPTSAVRRSGSTLSLKSKPVTAKPTSPTKSRPGTNVPASGPEKPSGNTSLSLREAIALKRAEAKKAQTRGNTGLDNMSIMDDALPPHVIPTQEDEDLLGRATLRETIEKARSTGSLNIATRDLKCLPSGLFEMHLNITPDPLKSVPDEQPLPPAPDDTGRGKRGTTTWFEAQDLHVIKAQGNEIQEIQHEISLFGSLKIIDLHKNKLTLLPDSIADLSMLATLDLSYNNLTTLPIALFALPELTNLNVSHNSLTALPFDAYFATPGRKYGSNKGTDFFAPAVVRATVPLPKLIVLNASHNKITAQSVHLSIPTTLTKIDLSANPLGDSKALLSLLSKLPRLKEIIMEKAEINDDSFPSDIFASLTPFPTLKIFDLSDTQVTLDTIKNALTNMKQELVHDHVKGDPPEGVTRVLVGKKVFKEAWEIALEQRTRHRIDNSFDLGGDWDEPSQKASARQTSISPSPSSSSDINSMRSTTSRTTISAQEVVKEAWELEAEAGLLTEGGKRRARAAAASQEQEPKPDCKSNIGIGRPSTVSRPPSTSVTKASLSNPQYYNEKSQILTLPPSQPPKNVGHNRAFSLAPSHLTHSSSPSQDITVPVPTLPLSVVVVQPFARTLRSLVLTNRRADRSLCLPSSACVDPQGFLPCLEELILEGCNLPDSVPVQRVDLDLDSPSTSPTSNARTTEALLPLISSLFPSLQTLNLSYNALTSAALTHEALQMLILSSDEDGGAKKGLRHLRLKGNKISDLDGFQSLAAAFKGNRDIPEWKLEELDLSDNDIGKLPAELGLMPLDVLLVDGNAFRVPQRRIWEREGTKGLLSWLRGRIE